MISQLEGKDYLEDTLIVIKDLTISPPSGDRYYCAQISSKEIVNYISINMQITHFYFTVLQYCKNDSLFLVAQPNAQLLQLLFFGYTNRIGSIFVILGIYWKNNAFV